ncbi:PRA1 family protein F3-like [Silene latifolia]|uniref:PRA1 family protein F3-like n=1 Tax=Silene latifolia TaxID=37657 RepID=UPI003D784A1C
MRKVHDVNPQRPSQSPITPSHASTSFPTITPLNFPQSLLSLPLSQTSLQTMSSSKQPIPTSVPPSTTPLSTNLDYISRAKQTLYTHLSTRRPWRQIFNLHTLSFPPNLSSAFTRLKSNLAYFRVNFAFFILLVLFLSLLWHPLSLIVFLLMMVAWTFLFFLRDEPLVLFRREIDDRAVLGVLSFFTLLALFFTGATMEIIISVAVGVGIVLVYSIFRKTDDLYLDEEEAAGAGLLAGRTDGGPGHFIHSPR